MSFSRMAALAGVALLLAAPAGRAGETCYQGGNDSGRLEFRGAVEGSGFTGRFETFTVEYCIPDADPAAGRIRVTVATGSADTDNRDRDEELLGDDFFQVEQHPRATWTSAAIRRGPDGEYVADGELEIRGIANSQQVNFTLEPDGEALRARGRFHMHGGAEIDRQDFGIGRGEFADPEFVRNRVDVTFELALQTCQ